MDINVFPFEVRGLVIQVRNQQGEAVGRFDWDPRFTIPQWLQDQRDQTFNLIDCQNLNDTVLFLGYELIESAQDGFILPVWYRDDPSISLADITVEYTILSTKDAYFSSLPFSSTAQNGISNQECLDQGLSPLSAEIVAPETTTVVSNLVQNTTIQDVETTAVPQTTTFELSTSLISLSSPLETTTQPVTTDEPTQEVTTLQNPLLTTSAQLILETTNAAVSSNTTTALITEPIELTTEEETTTIYSNTTSSFLIDRLSPSLWEIWLPLLIFFIPLSCFLLWIFFREKKKQDNEVHPEDAHQD
ncbi:Oidioi.mRNA.OKI2018_I69.PAR.g9506.t1.cds [Oikopleura dioica]|uniref:Oidioi.mRNA.OKI2018_I69.PAR.g9506.t1.cds n=1 Tax=Oikopleura dioica TaxID=34765 RepID=A0ABN7RPH8_OIKDI|nr:Oidioi.mRNA.OKI2018_I69.PAR.g9506.t1.cds [Oikopleura dioica]